MKNSNFPVVSISTFNLFAVSLLIGGLSACGGSQHKKLNDGQKQELAAVLNSTARTGTASKRFADKQNNINSKANAMNVQQLFLGQMALMTLTNTTAVSTMHSASVVGRDEESTNPSSGYDGVSSSDEIQTADKVLAPMVDEMTACTAQQSVPESNPFNLDLSGDSEFLLAVNGNCPIKMNFSMKVTRSTGKKKSVSATMTTDYAVSEDTFKKLNDVDDIKLQMSLNMESRDKDTALSKGSVNLNGYINSQLQGKVGVNGSGRVTSKKNVGNFEFTVNIKFKDFTAELLSKGTFTPGSSLNEARNIEYFLNGEKLTNEELHQLFEDGYTLLDQAKKPVGV